MNITRGNITDFFNEMLSDLNCQKETQAYIISIYGKYRSSQFDLSKDSITLQFAQAREKQDFLAYQNLGDWIFFVNTLTPAYVHTGGKEYYDTIARSSYYSCYKIINRKWKLFEELADNFNSIESQVKNKLTKISF